MNAKSGLRMRGGPGFEFDIIKTLPFETELSAGACQDDWIEVDLSEDDNNYGGSDSDSDGWVCRRYLVVKP